MTLLTQSAFAREAKVSRQAVHDAVKSGRLVMTGKKLDTNSDLNRSYLVERIDEVPVSTSANHSRKHDDDIDTKLKMLTLHNKKTRALKQSGDLIPKKTVMKFFESMLEYFQQAADDNRHDPGIAKIAQGACDHASRIVFEIGEYEP